MGQEENIMELSLLRDTSALVLEILSESKWQVDQSLEILPSCLFLNQSYLNCTFVTTVLGNLKP